MADRENIECSRKCRGTLHDPSCPKYQAAVAGWTPKRKAQKTRNEKPGRSHKKKDPAEVVTLERKQEIARENGQKGGRPQGSTNLLPVNAIKALKSAKFRVKAGMPEEAAEVAGWALGRICQVVAGNIHSRKAPSVLKGATQLREEICEPIVKEAKFTGSMTLENLVRQASEPEKK
jgi:hypothetical protein